MNLSLDGLPAAFAAQTPASITVADPGSDSNFQRAIPEALTVSTASVASNALSVPALSVRSMLGLALLLVAFSAGTVRRR